LLLLLTWAGIVFGDVAVAAMVVLIA